MPGTFFTTKERERLAGFPEDIPHWDLITYFTLTEHDRALIDTYHGEANRLGAALQLCAVRDLGFCPADLQAAPVAMVTFLASLLQVNPAALQTYGRRRMTRGAPFNAILHHLGCRRVQPEEHASMLTWLTERALEHDTPPLLFQTVCEHLTQQHLLRPAVTTLERWVVTARLQAHQESLHRLQPLLTRDRMMLLDRLLVPEPDAGRTPLYWLRQHATSNTPSALLDALSKISLLQQWEVDQWEMSVRNPHRQKFLARLGRKYTVQALRRMGPERRDPLLLAFLKPSLSDLTDESVDIFDVCLTLRHKKAREALKDYQDAIAETVGTHSQLLQTIGDLVLDDAIHDDRLRQAIYRAVPRTTLQAVVQEAHRLRRPNNYFDFLDDQ